MGGDLVAAGGKTLTIFLAADLKKFNNGLDNASRGLKGFSGNLTSMVGPALLATAAAAGALAIKFGVDGLKAAIEDEAALNKLAQTLTNVGLAHDQPMVEEFIGTLERATGIADDELRPAYDRLIRSIGDTAQANDALQLSLDISSGTGKSLQAVTEALGKAYDGNTAGLSRLGAGIDATVLKTGDMNKITAALSATFTGQAATSAGTYEGQIKRLGQATDNLKESFGRGLLASLGDTNNSTQSLVDTFEDLEPVIQGVGAAIGRFATSSLNSYNSAIKRTTTNTDDAKQSMKGLEVAGGATGNLLGEIFASLTGPNSPLGVFGRLLGSTEAGIDATATAAQNSVQYWNNLSYSVNMSTEAYAKYIQANLLGRQIIQNANLDYQDLAARQRVVNTFTFDYTLLTDKATTSTGSNSAAVDLLAKAEENLTDKYDKRLGAMTMTADKLSTEIGLLKDARKAVDDYVLATASSIDTLDLASIFGGSIGEDGKLIASDFISNFNTAVDQAPWFGNVLNALKQRGVDQTLVDELKSLGPAVGGGIGQAMLDDPGGLLETLTTKWVTVQSTFKTLAMGLVPEALLAGEESAMATVDGLATQLNKDKGKLNKLGKNIGKAVGVTFKAQLLEDIAEAIAEVEALSTAATAERRAQAARNQIPLTNAEIAQALTNTLRSADARNGLPVSPVLG